MGKIKLPTGIHMQVRPSGRVRYYWHPGRGTPSAGPRKRLPDDPHSPEFWTELAKARGETPDLAAGPISTKTISQMIDGYLVSSDFTALEPSTQKTYLRVLREMTAEMGGHDPRSLKPASVAAIRDKLKDQPGKAYTIMTVIAALYRWGVELGWADINPAKGVRKPQLGEHAPWPPEALAAIPQMKPSVAWVCMVGLYTGQRISDVVSMQRSRLRPGNKLLVRQMKTGKELLLPIHSHISRILTDTSEYICEQKPGVPWTRQVFYAAFDREVKKLVKAGVMPPVVYHGLRKNATVALVEAGCTPHEAASITGHSLKMVEHYTKTVHQSRLAEVAMGKYDLYPGTSQGDAK